MNKHCKQALSALLTIAMVLSLLIVPTSATGGQAGEPTISVTQETLELEVGKSADVTYNVTGDVAGVYVVSADANVASAGVDGTTVTVTGVAEGETTVYVVVSDTTVTTLEQAEGCSVKATIEVTVKAAAVEVPTEWNFRSGSTIIGTENGVKIEGTQGTWQALEIDATKGKFDSTRTDWAQTNTGVIIKVPVPTVQEGQIVELTLNAYGASAFTVDGAANNKAQEDEVFKCAGTDGYVTIIATANSYIGAIKVAVVEGSLVSEDPIGDTNAAIDEAIAQLPTVGGEGADKDKVVVQATAANTEAAVKAWVEELAQKAIPTNITNVEATVTIDSFTAAIDGTEADPDGTDGSFKATITLAEKTAQASLSAAGDETIVVEGVIKAKAFVEALTGAVGDKWVFADADFQTSAENHAEAPDYKGLKFDTCLVWSSKYIKVNKSLQIPVEGKCDVKLSCEYGNQGTVGVGENVVALEGSNGAGVTTTTYHYLAAEAGYVTVTSSGNLYLTQIEIVESTIADGDSLTLATESVEVEEDQKVTVSATVGGYEGKTLYAVSQDPATATVSVSGATITVTGVKAGATTVYAVMADAEPVDFDAAKAAEGSKGFEVTVTAKPVAPTITTKLEDGTYDFYNLKGTNEENQAVQDAVKGVDWGGAQPLLLDNKHGVNNAKYKGNYITFYVPDNCMANITVTTCCYGTGGNVKVNGEAVEPSSLVEEEGNAKVPVYTMTLVEGEVKFEFDGTLYIPKLEVKIVEKEEPMPSNGKIDVWDFAAEKLDETKYNNKLTVDAINAWYGADVAAGTTGVNIASFTDPSGLSFADGGKPKTHRIRVNEGYEAVTAYDRGKYKKGATADAAGGDPYESIPEGQEYITYNGYIYSNASSSKDVYVALKGLCEGDIITYIVGSNGSAGTYTFEAPDGSTQTAKFTNASQAEAITFYPDQLGSYRLYNGTDEKMVVCRIYRAPAKTVSLSGKVIISEDAPEGYGLVFTDKMTGKVTKANLVNNTYTADIFAGHDYELSLTGADEYVIEKDCQTLTVAYDGAPGSKTFDVSVQGIPMVTLNGLVTGLTSELMAKALLNFTAEETALYEPKPVAIGSDGKFQIRLEDGMSYMLAATGINDYEIISGTTGIYVTSSDTDSLQLPVKFQKKQVYNITIDTDGTIDVADLSDAVFTFYKLDEAGPAADQFTNPYNPADFEYPYTYTFTGTDSIALRAGTYALVVTELGAPEQLATANLVVTDKDVTMVVKFDTTIPNQWNFADADFGADDIADGNYKGLVLVKGVSKNKTYALAKGGEIHIPTAGASAVEVEFCYDAKGTIAGVPFVADTCKGSTSKFESVVYEIKDDADWVYVITDDATSTYFTKITVYDKTYEAVLKVGEDKDYKTINAALDAVAGMYRPNGERVTIEIDPGNYEEYVVVNSANVTFKNASATPSIMTANKGVDIDPNAVRITWYYGHGYDYYSMASDYSYDADTLAANKANGSFSTHNPGSGTGTMWNASVIIAANGFQADGIIFENSFNQYVSAASLEDVIVPYNGAKEGTVARADMDTVGDTKLQEKEYVERAGALSIKSGTEIVFNNCAFISRQDTLYGPQGSKVAFYGCDIYGGTDYIYGGMNAVFAKCNLVFNTNDQTEKGQKDDVGYITAPQQTSGRGYLMYNCTVTSTTPGVNTASTKTSKPGYLGRPWAANTGEAVFFETKVETTNFNDKEESLIQPTGWLNSLSGESALCGEYHTHELGRDMSKRATWAQAFTTPETADGAKLVDYTAWLGGWDPFTALNADMTITGCDLPTGIAIKDKADIYMVEGDVATTALVAEVTACEWAGTTDKSVTWSSEDTAIATVDATGKITAVAVGETNIVATAAAATEYTDSVKVIVEAKPVVVVDKTALETAVTDATAAMTGIEGIDAASEAEVAEGTKYVPTAVKAALETAIADANKVLADADATQAEVDAAKAAVDKALADFTAAIKTGTKKGETPTPVDTKALEAAIADAEKLVADTTVNDNPVYEVTKDTEYVTTETMNALKKAVEDAKAVLAKTDATQAEVDAAVAALNDAIKAFEDAKLVGTKTSSSSRPSGGSSSSSSSSGNKNIFGDTVNTVTDRNGNKTITVTRNGKVIAKVEIPGTIPSVDFKFTDVADDHWAADDIYKIAGLGLINGVSADGYVYDLNAPLTRGSLAAILYRLAQGNANGLKSSFADVAESAWYADAIAWAAEYGIVKGYSETTFGPDDPITREQLATMLYRFAQLLNLDMSKTSAISSFVDGSQVSDWAATAMSWDVGVGIIKGAGANNLVPLASASRAEAATMLARFIGLV